MKRWTRSDIAYLKANRHRPYAEIARHLGRSVGAVNAKYCMLALESKKVASWSDRDLETLRKMVRDGVSDKAVADKLGRSANAVRQRRLLLNIGRKS